MAKTFDEWWALVCKKYVEFGGGTEIYHEEFRLIAEEAWNAGRMNMTTGDI